MNAVEKCLERCKLLWGPPPSLTVSEWADKCRRLSPESSAEPGFWRTSRAAYQKGMMNALSDPLIEKVVIMSSAQIGKTEILNNIVGYFVDNDPSPILFVQPTIEMGQAWSKDRLAPMLRDTPSLSGKVSDVRSRTSNNTLLHKTFPGGHITITGANSGTSLASRPIRIVLLDEVDRYPVSAGSEGDPVRLASKRTTTFWNRKIVMTSTPTIKDASRIESAYEASDKRKYYVPCPKCEKMDVLSWSQVIWPKGEPSKALYQCLNCGAKLNHADKLGMIRKGEWRATAPFNGTAGFWLNELYSPWVMFHEMAENFVEAKKSPAMLQEFVNTSLGETWDDQGGETLPWELIASRREAYAADVPAGGIVLVAAVDIQRDRIELEIIAYGIDYETWGIEYIVIHGRPEGEEVWADLDRVWEKEYTSENGVKLKVLAVCVDSGDNTKRVYDYVKPREVRRIYATKGSSQAGKPLVSRPSISNLGKVKLFSIGTDTGKGLIHGRLKIDAHGPGYMHFPMGYDEEYFKQLTSEKKVTRFVKGVSSQKWIKIRPRNEALDIRVLGEVAFSILNPNLEAFEKDLKYQADVIESGGQERKKVETPTFRRRMISAGIS